MEKIDVKALSIALGVSWMLCILFAGIIAMYGWGTSFVEVMSSVYLGYEATPLGIIIGAIWAFIDGAIAGAVIALVYNFTTEKWKK